MMGLLWCISLSCDVFWATTRLPIDSNLVITLGCYPFLSKVVSTPLILDMWGSLMGVGSVMVLRLVIYGAATKPRVSCGCAHKVVLLGTRRYRELLVMIHYGATLMCCLPVNLFPSYLFLSCQKILVPNPDVSFVRIWNLDSWIQPFWCAYIIRQQPSNTANTHWLFVTVDASSASLWQ
jgi:hypothetical protein